MPEQIELSREELYDLVWSKPISSLSKQHGLSDVGFAKTCKRHDVPRPPRGYWAKLEFGKAPPKAPLPANDSPDLQQIIFFKRTAAEAAAAKVPRTPKPAPVYDPDILEFLERAKALPKIVVPTVLKCHNRFIRNTILSDQEYDEGRRLGFFNFKPPARERDDDYPLDISVFKESRQRGYRIFEALLSAIESIGFSVEVAGYRDSSNYWLSRGTFAVFGKEKVLFRVKEAYKLVERKQSTFSWKEHDKVGTGNFRIDNSSGTGPKTFCRDTSTLIEEKLNEAICRMIEYAGQRRIDIREEEELERKREEERKKEKERIQILEQKRDKLKAKQDAERAKLRDLLREVRDWRKSQEIRGYLAAVSRLAKCGKLNMTAEEFKQWRKWVNNQADRFDPLKVSPPSILDEPLPNMPRCWW